MPGSLLAQGQKDDFGGLVQFNPAVSLFNCLQAFAVVFYWLLYDDGNVVMGPL